MYPQIYANRPAGAIMANILGPRPQIRYIRTNTLVGNTPSRQDVHKVSPPSSPLVTHSLTNRSRTGLLIRSHVSSIPHGSQHQPGGC